VEVFSCWSTWVQDSSLSTRRRRSTRRHRRRETWLSILTFGRERPVHSITRTHLQEEHNSIYLAWAEIQLGGRVQGQKCGCPGMAFVSMQCVDYEYQAFILVQLGKVAHFEISKLITNCKKLRVKLWRRWWFTVLTSRSSHLSVHNRGV
jgi:hypothetical protein